MVASHRAAACGQPAIAAAAHAGRIDDRSGAVGVTGMTKVAVAPGAKPAGIVQVTCCALTVQPAGIAPRVSVAATLSVTVVIAVVAAVPSLTTVRV